MRAMVIEVPLLSGYAKVRHVAVSLARIDYLIADHPTKYHLPGDEPAASEAPDNTAIQHRLQHPPNPGKAEIRRRERAERERAEARVLAEIARGLERAMASPDHHAA